MIRLTKPLLAEDERLEVDSVLASGYLSRGSKVVEFEAAVAAYLDVKHAISVSSGTAALHLSLLTLDLSPSDEVIVPDFTFPATANAVVLAGATPILCDVRLDSFNLDPEEVMRATSPRTKVIMPVHQFGLAADMNAISNLAQERAITIIEDAACSLGAEFQGRKCGTFGLISCFSFHPRKIVTTGEGGVVVTNDDQLASKIRALRHHGIDNDEFKYAGFNYRMSDLNAALGVAQMRRIPDIIESRRKLAAAYRCALTGIAGIHVPQDLDHSKHTYQSFVVLLDKSFDRNEAIRALHDRGVEATIGTYAVHWTKFYSERYRFDEERFRQSTTAYRQSLTLPMYPEMSIDQVQYVCDSLIDCLKAKN